MLNAYEKRLAFNWLGNMMGQMRRRGSEASDLVSWLDENQSALGLGAKDWPASDHLETLADSLRGPRAVPLREWHRFVRVARVVRARWSAHARAKLDRTARRLRALGDAVGISRTDVAILEVLVRRQNQPLFDSLVDVLDGPFASRVKCDILPPCSASRSRRSATVWRRMRRW